LSEYRYIRAVLLEIAITAEDSARDFHMTLAKKLPKHEALFEQFATDEKNYAKVYTDLLDSKGLFNGRGTYASGFQYSSV